MDCEFEGQEIEIGIDEAGRGPVLGALVYGCVWWPAECGDEMRKVFGFIDSKQTTESQREEMFERIKEMGGKRLGWAICATSPEELSNSMLALNSAGG